MPSLIRKLDRLYATSPVLSFDACSRIALMSDCHRGQGNGGDNFLPNSPIFQGALEYYYQNGFTYIELGDGDELWENRYIHTIIQTHSRIFRLMSQFHREERLYMLYGNHDMVKRRRNFSDNLRRHYTCDMPGEDLPRFPGLQPTQSLILENRQTGQQLFLIHGHQDSLINDELWFLGRFLVRYVWRPLEIIGFRAPTGSGQSVKLVEKTERDLCSYAQSRNRILIAGHTHRPVFPVPGSCPYFNDGSCVHPHCITALEIEENRISLIQWAISTALDRTLYISREVIGGPENLADYG